MTKAFSKQEKISCLFKLMERYENDEIKYSYLVLKLRHAVYGSELENERSKKRWENFIDSLETRKYVLGNNVFKNDILKELGSMKNFLQKNL